MKTLIALDDQEELIDKFEGAMDGINGDMALAEKALKVRTADLYVRGTHSKKYGHSFKSLRIHKSKKI